MREVEGWTAPDGDPFDIFKNNLDKVEGDNSVIAYNQSVESVVVESIPHSANVVFYDGDHNYDSTKNFLDKYYSKFEETLILIVDDWNWPQIQSATRDHIQSHEYEIQLEKEILTKGEDPEDYWNGLGVFVLRKKREHIT